MGKGDKKEEKTAGDKKSSGKGSKGPARKPCSKGGVFMGGTMGISTRPDRNHYYNVVVSRDGSPGHSQPCKSAAPSAGITPIIICPPNNYPPASCPTQPRRRCC